MYSLTNNRSIDKVGTRKWMDGHTHGISWGDYQSKVYPDGIKNINDTRRKNIEWRRWRLADQDNDNSLTKSEFKVNIINIKYDSYLFLICEYV